MVSKKLIFLSLLFVSMLFLQACQNEKEAFLETEDVENARLNNGDGNGNNGFGNNNGNGNNNANALLSEIDNNVVYEWTNVLLEVERYAGGMRPNATARALAYIYLASYETGAPGMETYVSNTDQLNGLQIDEQRMPRNVNFEIALNEAFSKTLDHFLINVSNGAKQRIDELEEELEDQLRNNVPNRVVDDSKRWGRYVAKQVIEYSQTDQAAEAQILEPQPTSYEPPTGDGFWTYSAAPERALFPYWESVRTFIISPDETSTVPPIAYSEQAGSPYFEQMMEAYNENNEARQEDGEELWIAEFWSDDVEELTFSPPARQYSIANQLIEQHGMNLEETLYFYLKLGFSLNDAAVSTWKYKYDYMVMRPNVFIHEFIDPDFQTNLFRLVYWPNPSFPGYPSGHSCFASAAAGVFIDFFGNNISFTDRSHEGRQEFRGAARSFNSFEEMADENGYSRIPLGVHIRMDCTEGLRLGYEISNAVNEYNLLREPI